MKKSFSAVSFAAALGIPLAAGILSAFLTGDAFASYARFEKPGFAPPGAVFPFVWAALYLMMGAASYIVYLSSASRQRKKRALALYAAQLGVNFLWPLIFFRLELFTAALIWLLLLTLLLFLCTALFYHIDKRAGALLLPYLLWCSFAVFLNYCVALLN